MAWGIAIELDGEVDAVGAAGFAVLVSGEVALRGPEVEVSASPATEVVEN